MGAVGGLGAHCPGNEMAMGGDRLACLLPLPWFKYCCCAE